MRIVSPLLAAVALTALARPAPAQQPKPVAPPVVVPPVKPMPVPGVSKATPAAPAKTPARKYPIVITTPTIDVELAAKGAAPLPFKPVTITTAQIDVELAGPAAPPALPPFTPRSIHTDTITVLLTHP